MIETEDLTNLTLTHPNVRKLLANKDEKFDLLYIEGFLNDAFLGKIRLTLIIVYFNYIK